MKAVQAVLQTDYALQAQFGIDYETMTRDERYALFELLFVEMMFEQPADEASCEQAQSLFARLTAKPSKIL